MSCVQLAGQESSVEELWDVGIVQPANSLIRYNLFLGEDGERCSGFLAWAAQHH